MCAGWAEDIGRREEMDDGFVSVDCFARKRGSAYFAIYDGCPRSLFPFPASSLELALRGIWANSFDAVIATRPVDNMFACWLVDGPEDNQLLC